jgi:hypothetical protein
MSTINAESQIAGWFCIYCEEDFDTENQVDLHLAGDNRCSKINNGRKNSKLVQDSENPNHYYTVFNEPTADEPTADEPTADEPTADEPTADEPTADEPTADEHVVSKSNDTFNKINDLIWHGFCMTGTIEYSRNTSNAYTKIKELLQDTKNTLSQKEVQDLRETYSFITNDVHGYYPRDDCHMFNMLRTATII